MVKASQKQLPLGMGLRDDCTLDTYYPGTNLQVVAQIKEMALGKGEQFIYLWGRSGVGLSHLLQGACHFANLHQHSAIYLPLNELLTKQPEHVLDNAERLELVCLDEIQEIKGSHIWEEALFHLFNRLRAVNHRLIVAAKVAPSALGIQLPDLQSRLSWGVTYQVHPLEDEALLGALQLRAKERGLELPNEVGVFLIRRCSRTMPELYRLLEELDKASLAAQRRLTVPFIKSVLDL